MPTRTENSEPMVREETVFGPIFSRRLGSSLGINLLPRKGKICNFDCIYCECGWNRDGLGDRDIPSAADVHEALEEKLRQIIRDGIHVDSITFSGDGEPTLNPEFPKIIEDTLSLRDRMLPTAKVSVLTNATRIHVPEIFRALTKVDNPIMKLDAPTDEAARLINRPSPGYSVQRTVEQLGKFGGNFVLQTMFLRSRDFDSSEPAQLSAWMDIVRQLRPRKIMVYTIARPTPMEGLEKFTEEEMRRLVQPLADEGFNIEIRG